MRSRRRVQESLEITLRSYEYETVLHMFYIWAKHLSLYQRILNNDPKEVIAHKTACEIYLSRKCNAFRESRLQDEILPSAGRVRPTKNDRNRRSRQALKLRKQAKKATSRCDKRMQWTQHRLNPSSVYSIGEKVYIRLGGNHRINGMWRRGFHTPHRFQERKKGNGSLWTISQA